MPPFFHTMFSLFQTKRGVELEQFARGLADDLAKRYPPELDNNPSKHPSVNRLTRILEDTCQKASDFQSTHGLGVFGKAKFGNTFKWALTDLGYRKEFIDIATEAVIVYLSKRNT